MYNCVNFSLHFFYSFVTQKSRFSVALLEFFFWILLQMSNHLQVVVYFNVRPAAGIRVNTAVNSCFSAFVFIGALFVQNQSV